MKQPPLRTVPSVTGTGRHHWRKRWGADGSHCQGRGTGRALVYQGPGAKEWRDVPDAAISEPTDAVVRADTTTICWTDLHILPGDVPAVTKCGRCAYCQRGMPSHGQTVGGIGGIFGHLIDGTQAESVRVPYADTSLYSVPESVPDDQAIFLADSLPAGYEVGVLAGQVRPATPTSSGWARHWSSAPPTSSRPARAPARRCWR